jgi:hypothetical protein
MVSVIILYYNLMGPPAYMRSVIDRNITMRYMPVLSYLICHWMVKINKREIYAISLHLYNSTSLCFIILPHLALSLQPSNLESNLFSRAALSGPLCHLNLWFTWCHLCWFLFIECGFWHQILKKVWPKRVMLGVCGAVVWAACQFQFGVLSIDTLVLLNTWTPHYCVTLHSTCNTALSLIN